MTILTDLFKDRTRTAKPRDTGITHVMDKGMSLADVNSLIEVAEEYVDIVKLGWCTSVVSKNLERKLTLYKSLPVTICCGGSLFELAIAHGKVPELIRFYKDWDFKVVEVSDGVVDYPRSEKLKYIEMLAKDFTVLSEVGKKDRRKAMHAPSMWIGQMKEDLEAGAWKVIAEGRESGTVGLFNEDGSPQTALIEEIVSKIDFNRIIFETPQRDQQVWMVRHFGANVNLGNIASDDVISLETIREKLRGDTMPQSVIVSSKAADEASPTPRVPSSRTASIRPLKVKAR